MDKAFKMNKAEQIITDQLGRADIKINGNRPWDITIRNPELFGRVARQGTLGAGESYMEGWWDCERLDEMFYKAIKAQLEHNFSDSGISALALKLYQSLFNLQNRTRAFEVGKKHYDFDNALFEWMLGPSMNYSCGYWRNASDLDSAQNAKMELICRKLRLKPGMTVLDIGCGWGALAAYMKEHYEVEVTGISISEEQIRYARDKWPAINFLLEDYRSLEGKFDRIVSVGMFEHVGYKNYDEFMRTAHRLLKSDGLFLLHTIGANRQRKGTDPWIDKYIFPNGMLPSQENMVKAFAPYFIMEDWHNFGADYDKTLMAWSKRFEQGCDENKFAHTEEMRRMFRFYLLSCAAAFRARDIQLWQLVLSPQGVPGGYLDAR